MHTIHDMYYQRSRIKKNTEEQRIAMLHRHAIAIFCVPQQYYIIPQYCAGHGRLSLLYRKCSYNKANKSAACIQSSIEWGTKLNTQWLATCVLVGRQQKEDMKKAPLNLKTIPVATL